jgi:hypothetical protein
MAAERRSPARRAASTTRLLKHFGLLLTIRDSALYLGVGETRFREIRALDASFPQPRQLPGPNAEERYLVDDLEAWAASLRPVEKQRCGTLPAGDRAVGLVNRAGAERGAPC